GAVAPASRLRLLRRLEVLVALEEVLDLVAQLGIDVVDVAYALERRVAERHAQHLLVGTLLVAHVEDPDRPDADATAGKRRFRDEDERVERVSVLREGSLEVAVVRRIRHRGEEATIEDDPAELFVPLVFVARPRWDLDEDDGLVGHARTVAGASACSRSRIRSPPYPLASERPPRFAGFADGAHPFAVCVMRVGPSLCLS